MSAELRAECVGKQYGFTRVLTAASILARPASVTALVGRNGAGKSTFLKICAGWIRADHGTITYRDRTYTRPRLHTLAREGLCYLPAEQPLLSPAFSLGKQLEAVARECRSSALGQIINRFRLGTLLRQRPPTLSGGERRRASFAVVELIDPQCLLADEPLQGLAPLDAELIVASLATLKGNGCAIVISGHDLSSMFAASDQIVWMTAGTTYSLGEPATARENWQFAREFLGTVSTQEWP